MAEFDITDWCDFVRGVVDEDTREAMNEALAAGSAELVEQVAWLRQIAALGRRDSALQIPDHALRRAKLLPRLAGLGKKDSTLEGHLRFLPFQVAFDSAVAAAPASGTRSARPVPRALVARTDRFEIEVRLELADEPDRIHVVGLLSDLRARPMVGVGTVFVAADEIVHRTTTNRFGEFNGLHIPREHPEIYLLVDSDQCLVLSL